MHNAETPSTGPSTGASMGGGGPTRTLEPTAPSERLVSLDLLRGVALLGILMVNSLLFSLPLIEGVAAPDVAHDPTGEVVAWWIVRVGFEFAAISTFSILFGAGFALLAQRAAARGRSVVEPYVRRAGVLVAIGALHVTLLWFGDILLVYGLLAMVLLACGRLSSRVLLWAGSIVALFGAAMTMLLGVLMALATHLADADDHTVEAVATEPLRGFAAMMAADFDPSSPIWVEAETAAHIEGPFVTAMLFRVVLYAFSVIFGVLTYAWHVVGCFLIGAGLMKAGFFSTEPAPATDRVRSLLMLALPTGLAIRAASAAVVQANGENSLSGAVATAPQMIGAVLVAIGLAATACVVTQRRILDLPTRLIAAAGRMPLTLYLMQSVIFVAIMDHWGLARFGTFDRVSLIGLTLAVWTGQVIFANLWFTTFRIGPLEWLWRSFTYLHAPRLRA